VLDSKRAPNAGELGKTNSRGTGQEDGGEGRNKKDDQAEEGEGGEEKGIKLSRQGTCHSTNVVQP